MSLKAELSALVLAVGSKNPLDKEAAARVLAGLTAADLESGEFLNILDRADFITLGETTFEVDDAEANAGGSHENFVAAFLKKSITVSQNFLGQLLAKVKKEREGSLARHLLIMQVLSGLRYLNWPQQFSASAHTLSSLLEYVFTEIYQASTHQSSVYTGEQVVIMQTKGFKKLKAIALNFVKTNHDLLGQGDSLIKLSDYLKIIDSFTFTQTSPIPDQQTNKAAFIKFLGGTIAKLEFAKFFSNLQGHTDIGKLLGEFQGLFKPFHEKLMGDPIAILEAQVEYVNYRKTRELCLENMPKGQNMVNLHALIQVDAEEHSEPWSGYGANFCSYLLRQTVLAGTWAHISLGKRLGLISAILSTTPRDYLRGGDYYQPLLETFLELKKLPEVGVSIQETLDLATNYGFRMSDFLFALFTIAQQANTSARLIEEVIDVILSNAGDNSIKYMTMLKVADILTDARDLASSEPFLSGFASVCFKSITDALATIGAGQPRTFQPFLQESLLGRYFGAMLRADAKQISSFRKSRVLMDKISQVAQNFSPEERWVVRHTIWDILSHWSSENKKDIAKKISVRIAEVKSLRSKFETTSSIVII